ncbi:MAG: hypothetical protein QOK42_1301 [Frankiaceae bacterium]|jgi:hypothetical protein|nr:hypothetical protein [Frankiaceae bacterium]MDX6274144.1 hypothetical protein [Frankiales bacterium]
MRKRTAAIALSGALVSGAAGALLVTPASAATSSNPVTSRLAHIKSALSGLVSDGTLTQQQADKVAATLDQKLPHRGDGPGKFGGPRGHHELKAHELTAAAKALGMTPAALRTELRSGKSLAVIAKAKGVSVDTLVTALVNAAKADIAAQVKAGWLTQAQANKITADLKQRITDRVNHVRPPRPEGPHGDGPGGPAPEGAEPSSNA